MTQLFQANAAWLTCSFVCCEISYDEIRYRLKETVGYYTDWGGLGKVNLLNDSCGDVLHPKPKEIHFYKVDDL